MSKLKAKLEASPSGRPVADTGHGVMYTDTPEYARFVSERDYRDRWKAALETVETAALEDAICAAEMFLLTIPTQRSHEADMWSFIAKAMREKKFALVTTRKNGLRVHLTTLDTGLAFLAGDCARPPSPLEITEDDPRHPINNRSPLGTAVSARYER